MANMFSNDARTFKFDVMVQLAKEAYSEKGVQEEEIQAWARKLVTLGGPRYRCCVYKEREVLRQRVRLAMGMMANDAAEYNPHQIVQVIDAACDGCTIKKIRVTDNCRKCMAKSCMAACRFRGDEYGLGACGDRLRQVQGMRCLRKSLPIQCHRHYGASMQDRTARLMPSPGMRTISRSLIQR
jgi:hypothetical protein